MKGQLTEAEQEAFEAEMAAAGITVTNPPPGTTTITLLAKKPDEQPTEGTSAA